MQLQSAKSSEFETLKKELQATPFWRKPDIWKKMREDHKIPVSVTRVHPRWNFKGAGIVDAPRAFCFQKAKDFDQLRQIPDHFKDVSFNPQTSILHLKIQFLGRTRDMHLQMSEEVLTGESRVYFRSVRGWLLGLEGALSLKDHERHATEIAIFAIYPGKINWVPDWLFSVAAEGVMHHVAETLRKSLEADYKMSRGESTGVQRNQSAEKDPKIALGS